MFRSRKTKMIKVSTMFRVTFETKLEEWLERKLDPLFYIRNLSLFQQNSKYCKMYATLLWIFNYSKYSKRRYKILRDQIEKSVDRKSNRVFNNIEYTKLFHITIIPSSNKVLSNSSLHNSPRGDPNIPIFTRRLRLDLADINFEASRAKRDISFSSDRDFLSR